MKKLLFLFYEKMINYPLILAFLFSISFNSYSKDSDFMDLIIDYQIDVDHSNIFERILIQDDGGRIKPISTLAAEYVRKMSRKNSLFGNNSSQILLGMMANPEIWSQAPMIKVSHPEIKLLFKTDADRIPFSSFFNEDDEYILSELVREAYLVTPSSRGSFHKDVIQIDERANIAYSILNTIYHESTLKMFPIKEDQNNKWDYHIHQLPDSLQHFSMINAYLSSVHSSIINGDWEMSDTILSIIGDYQKEHGSAVVPDSYKVELEVWYNKLNIFSNLFMYYFVVGIILLILLFIKMFYNRLIIRALIKTSKVLIVLGFLSHILALASRWIISGHAPWSNGYESMIYIAFATMFSGFIFSKRSSMALAATSLIASMILMVAHLNWLDPEITNLVPVLDSYWLMIHVSMITASYGFLACGSLLSIISLCLMIFVKKSNKTRLISKIKEFTIINEKTITIGLFMLVIGTFLGGIWANQSWGRYWGWDPKETWALVSILVYAFILHMRFIPSLSSRFHFTFMSMTAIKSIIMTYFGVNYYLSGLHSYAAGDPIPIPFFLYFLILIFLVLGFFSFFRFRKHDRSLRLLPFLVLIIIFYPEVFIFLRSIIFEL